MQALDRRRSPGSAQGLAVFARGVHRHGKARLPVAQRVLGEDGLEHRPRAALRGGMGERVVHPPNAAPLASRTAINPPDRPPHASTVLRPPRRGPRPSWSPATTGGTPRSPPSAGDRRRLARDAAASGRQAATSRPSPSVLAHRHCQHRRVVDGEGLPATGSRARQDAAVPDRDMRRVEPRARQRGATGSSPPARATRRRGAGSGGRPPARPAVRAGGPPGPSTPPSRPWPGPWRRPGASGRRGGMPPGASLVVALGPRPEARAARGLLRRPARLRKARQATARAKLRDREVDPPGTRPPGPARSPSRQAVLPAPIRPPTSASISSRSPLWATARRKSSSPRFASSSAIGSLSSVIGAVVGLGGEAQHRHPTRCARRPTRTAPPGVRNAPPPATPRSPPETTPSSRTLVPEEVAAAAGCGGDGAAGALRLLVAHEDGACDRNALGRKRQAAAWSGRRRPPPAPRLRIRHRAVPCARGDDFPRGRGVPPLPMLYAEIADRRCGRPPTRRIVWHGAEASARPRRQSGSPKVPSPVPPHGGPWGPAFRRPIAFTRSPPHGSGRRRSQPRQAFGRERIRLAREGRDAFDPSHPARGKAWHFDAAPSSGIACWTISLALALAPALDRGSRADGVPCRRGRVRWSTERAGASASATRPRRGTEPSARDSG
jgi:hypothetical protein